MAQKTDIKTLSYFILHYCINSDISISHLKLQKLLYYIQAWHLVYFEENIFEEQPEAWVNGPVYRPVYSEFKKLKLYDNIELREQYKDKAEELFNQYREQLNLEPEQFNFLEAILNHYGKMHHDKLVYLTHSEEPWNNARKDLQPFEYSDEKISFKEMKRYYNQILHEKKEKQAS